MKKILLLLFLMTFSLGYSQPGASPADPPARNTWDVLSVFSDSYTNQTGVQYLTFGGSTINADFTPPGGTPAKYYTGHSFSGIQVNTAGSLDVSQMTHLHFDVYSPNYSSMAIKLESSTTTARELAVTGSIVPSSTTRNQWISIDLALSTYNLGNILTSLKYIVPVTFGQNATLYIDNIYFYRAATVQPPTFNSFPAVNKIVTDPQFNMIATSNSAGAITYSSSATSVATIDPNTGLVTIVGAGTTTITANQAASTPYGSGSTTATLTVTPPAAPTPPARNAWDVVSLYSGSYTPTSGATWQAGTDVSIGGNNARFFNGFTLARLAFAPTTIAAMTTLHIDVYTLNQNQLWFEINGNRKVVSSIPLNGWASFDIPLSDYVGLNLGNVSFFDLNNPTGAAAPVKVVYLDNIYFYRAATDTPPTIGALTVPTPQVFGNAPFTLTNPTSNSGGAWTYSSNPAGVVTFSGNTATIVGGGTTTITATQAAVPGSFGSGTATATLVVNFPAPGPSPIPPARNAIDVVSMYTGTPTTYANGTTAVQAGWSTGSTNSNFNFANGTNTCIQVNNLGFFGLVTNGANFSVVGMNFLHVDIYVNTPMTSMILNLLAPGDRNYSIGPLATGWNSFDIPLTTYPGALNNINGIKFEQSGGTPRQIYIDNVYFFNGTANPTITNFSIPTKSPGDTTFTITPPTSNSGGAWTYSSSDDTVGQIVNGNQIQVGTGGSCTITATQAAAGIYNSGSITATFNVLVTPTLGTFTVPAKVTGDAPFALTAPSSDSAGAFTYTILPAGIATISGSTVTIVGPGTATITATQAANGLFSSASTNASLVVSLGTPAPTPPARNAWDVVSLYSNSYTPTSGAVWQAGTNVDIAGNDARLFNGFTLARLAFAPTTIAAMTTLHIDVYTVNQNQLWFEINGNRKVVSSIPLNGWASFDIPLSDYVGLNLGNVSFFDLNNPTGAAAPVKVVYLDNIYFYRAPTDAPPTIGALSVASPQVLGNAPFTLTNPTSNSGGAWTYSASPAGVVTISGNTVTIVGGGTTTITATQAAVPGVFGPGSATATLVVNFPDPTPSPSLPARDPARVISMYTGTPAVYTNAPNYNFGQAFWSTGGGRVLTEVPNGTNTALRIDGLGFMGLIDIGNPPPTNRERRLNLTGTGMSHLNIDIYLDAPRPNLFLVLLAPGDRLYNTGALVAGWNRLRVPLTAYPGALNDIYGLKIEQNYTSAFRIFIDNVYFSNDLFTFYADSDGDGFGDLASSVLAETAPDGYVSNSTDCNDTDNSVWTSGNFYIDADGDGYNLDLSPDSSLITVCYGATLSPFYTATTLGSDCSDDDSTVWRNGNFYSDVDNDNYSSDPGLIIPVCYGASEPDGLSLALNLQVDCDDNNVAINPGATEVCYNNIDDNCSGTSSEACSPVVVNMLSSLNNATLVSLATAIPALPYSYGGFTNIKYRFSITNTTTGVTAPDIIQISRFVTIPAAIHTHGASYTITASAVINEEIVPFAGNTITVNSPSVPVITLSTSSCGATLTTLASSLTANPGLNATGYTFRIRLNDANPSPTYGFSPSATRFVGANTFTGFPLQYGASYRVAVQYTFTDPVSGLPVNSGYGAECVVNTPSIPVTSMASPTCGGTVSALNANMAARAASYATGYRFRIRLFSDNGPTPTYYQTAVLPGRFSSLTAFQGITIAYSTEYAISVQYSVLNGATTEWSAFGPDCKVTTPFFPTTSLVPSQCGLMTATSLTQQLNITPYPGFPNYKVLLEEVEGEDVITSEERELVYSNFKLSDFAIAQLGKNYNVSVAIKLNGVFGDYSTACDLFTEEAAPSKALVQTPFKATAYPNPFANNFMLDVKTSSQSSVSVKVYDMVGRLIEQKEVSVSDMESTTIGNQYPSGVYNVVIAQEDSLQTLRVIKR
ncbi:MopE-related protein [Flavobacterium sp. 25HG05S-40]|uniref:MopE-related protein n=1 Tax=Flavobacterium sp. 25HG05S-40 TaxID=3458682 RepID=UPI004044D64F